MADSNSGLLIAALVAIVAVVGLVILFKGGNSGQAITIGQWDCAEGYEAIQYHQDGGLICRTQARATERHIYYDAPYIQPPQSTDW